MRCSVYTLVLAAALCAVSLVDASSPPGSPLPVKKTTGGASPTSGGPPPPKPPKAGKRKGKGSAVAKTSGTASASDGTCKDVALKEAKPGLTGDDAAEVKICFESTKERYTITKGELKSLKTLSDMFSDIEDMKGSDDESEPEDIPVMEGVTANTVKTIVVANRALHSNAEARKIIEAEPDVISRAYHQTSGKAPDAEAKAKADKVLAALRPALDKFVAKHQNAGLIELLMSANYIAHQPIMDAAGMRIAATFNGKTPAQIRQEWNIPADLTWEEQKDIAKAHGLPEPPKPTAKEQAEIDKAKAAAGGGGGKTTTTTSTSTTSNDAPSAPTNPKAAKTKTGKTVKTVEKKETDKPEVERKTKKKTGTGAPAGNTQNK